MAEFKVTITETYQKSVYVEAEDYESAEDMVRYGDKPEYDPENDYDNYELNVEAEEV